MKNCETKYNNVYQHANLGRSSLNSACPFLFDQPMSTKCWIKKLGEMIFHSLRKFYTMVLQGSPVRKICDHSPPIQSQGGGCGKFDSRLSILYGDPFFWESKVMAILETFQNWTQNANGIDYKLFKRFRLVIGDVNVIVHSNSIKGLKYQHIPILSLVAYFLKFFLFPTHP
ncbi:hypothetical protein VP01_2139g2 [Puccinia sorghi]|uniref:Uncharacterized protein n=1 Tax=Puccinia sorghi TaxID=27349 RepID=A0A0L6VBL3_9BASI|nr:hypothetical protein VP01_2139g2 [Puccinia sorghi]